MNRFELDGVESEKANAMRRYRRRRNFLNVLRAAEAAAAVALLGYWWLPTAAIALEIAGDWFRRIGAVLDSGLAILVIVNLLIIWIVALSRQNTENQPDLYDQYVSASAASGGEAGDVDQTPEERDHPEDKHMIVPASQQRIESVEKRPRKEEANAAKPNQDKVRCEAVTAVKEMEGLSDKAFREKIDKFIEEKKRTLRHENDVVQCKGRGRTRSDHSRPLLVRSGGA